MSGVRGYECPGYERYEYPGCEGMNIRGGSIAEHTIVVKVV